jgi:hypothetical protein
MSDARREVIRLVLGVIVWLVALASMFAVSLKFYRALTPEVLSDVVSRHFNGAVMMPLSTLFALLIVMVFKSTGGPVEFEALGFKFKGAAGEAAMWIACFLAITVAAKLLF